MRKWEFIKDIHRQVFIYRMNLYNIEKSVARATEGRPERTKGSDRRVSSVSRVVAHGLWWEIGIISIKFYKDIADFFDKIQEMKEFTRTASRFHPDSKNLHPGYKDLHPDPERFHPDRGIKILHVSSFPSTHTNSYPHRACTLKTFTSADAYRM